MCGSCKLILTQATFQENITNICTVRGAGHTSVTRAELESEIRNQKHYFSQIHITEMCDSSCITTPNAHYTNCSLLFYPSIMTPVKPYNFVQLNILVYKQLPSTGLSQTLGNFTTSQKFFSSNNPTDFIFLSNHFQQQKKKTRASKKCSVVTLRSSPLDQYQTYSRPKFNEIWIK